MRASLPVDGYPFFDWPAPLAFAHRGGSSYAANRGLENSRRAFQHAVDLGYRYLETDVHATADGVLLALHDKTLDRVTDASGRIARLTYAEVKAARIGGREPIPTLAELFEAWPDVRLNVDVKDAGAIAPLVTLVRRMGVQERICVASFSSARISRVRALLGPRVATALAPLGVAGLRMLPVPRLRGWLLGSSAPAVQVPRLAGRIRIVTPAFLTRAHQLGKQVHVWTVDDGAEMAHLLDQGVDGIMTDRIDTLREVLLDRDQWPVPGRE